METQSYVYMLLWLYNQSSLNYNRGSFPEIQLVNLADFCMLNQKRTFPWYCPDQGCGLAFGGRSAPASYCPIQPSFPMACSWPRVIASLLLHLCPCGQVGWRNLIQLQNNLWKKINKRGYFPVCFAACLEKDLRQHGTVGWGERRETRGESQPQGQLLLVLVWPPKSCSALCTHGTLPVTDFHHPLYNCSPVSFIVFLSKQFLSV